MPILWEELAKISYPAAECMERLRLEFGSEAEVIALRAITYVINARKSAAPKPCQFCSVSGEHKKSFAFVRGQVIRFGQPDKFEGWLCVNCLLKIINLEIIYHADWG